MRIRQITGGKNEGLPMKTWHSDKDEHQECCIALRQSALSKRAQPEVAGPLAGMGGMGFK
jgi:hypothetical protein